MLRATLTFVRRGEALVTATSLAVFDAPDEDFLARHVARLREVTAAEDAVGYNNSIITPPLRIR